MFQFGTHRGKSILFIVSYSQSRSLTTSQSSVTKSMTILKDINSYFEGSFFPVAFLFLITLSIFLCVTAYCCICLRSSLFLTLVRIARTAGSLYRISISSIRLIARATFPGSRGDSGSITPKYRNFRTRTGTIIESSTIRKGPVSL